MVLRRFSGGPTMVCASVNGTRRIFRMSYHGLRRRVLGFCTKAMALSSFSGGPTMVCASVNGGLIADRPK